MAAPRNDEIQEVLVAQLKANANVLAELDDTDEIREDQWQGRDFSYPNIRVRLISNKPRVVQADCTQTEISVGFQVFSEDDSSQQADRIAGIIQDELHAKSFIRDNIQITLATTNLIPAFRIGQQNVWRSEVLMNGTTSG